MPRSSSTTRGHRHRSRERIRWCPCAACQGHAPGLRFHDHGEAISLSHAEEVGAYALALRFSDGHDTGIFSWAFLRQLAEGRDPQRV